MNISWRLLSLLSAVVCVACGGAVTNESTAITTQSQVVNSVPPTDNDSSGATAIMAYWKITRTDNVITLLPDDATVPKMTLVLSGEKRVLAVTPWYVYTSGAPELRLLVGTIDFADIFRVWSFDVPDNTSLPDATTQTLLFSSGSAPMFVTRMVRRPNTSKLVLLDRRCQDIWVATDTNGDQLPDTLATTAFAASQSYPALANAAMITVAADGSVHVPSNSLYLSFGDAVKARAYPIDFYAYTDGNSDGVAETETTYVPSVYPVPATLGLLYAGQGSIKVKGTGGMTAQIFEVQSDGAPGLVLGGAQTNIATWTSISLSRTVNLGEHLGARYSVGDDWVPMTVRPAWPQLESAGPNVINLNGGTVQVEGVLLSTSCEFRLVKSTDESTYLTLAATVTSSESATVTIPQLTTSWLGGQYLRVHDTTVPASLGSSEFVISVVDDS